MPGETDINVEIVVPNQTRYLSLIGNIAEQVAKVLDISPCDRELLAYYLNLVLTEAMVNAIQHALPSANKNTVKVCIHIDDSDLIVQVYDHGQGFDLNSVPSPKMEDLCESGRGIFFIRSFMDGVSYRRTEEGNVLEMYKKLG